ncbi:MAG: hypothetical protein JW841_05290 [Deltaproteobacteria bacterium]|nr:hypothetical protein [Deltaproteobacteria bacterium]
MITDSNSDLEPPKSSCPHKTSKFVPYHDFIAESLQKGRNAKAIWHDLVDDHGFSGAYPSVLRYVKTIRGS